MHDISSSPSDKIPHLLFRGRTVVSRTVVWANNPKSVVRMEVLKW
jgi:hypothetical protein